MKLQLNYLVAVIRSGTFCHCLFSFQVGKFWTNYDTTQMQRHTLASKSIASAWIIAN